ncbi:MAG TPA: glycoside hydrolase family 9 protein [Oligoflexus sp.]|uniref:glycoside hydrolase family 9 protein n=1 Tax=Oligoflexus sp. TaxID=1971216 RepID=UPI002D242614|nr:glycoside hydrolase family 9 protein [Oligoflexus sp.]HYX32556.1 glycoside hydrolase family 9 protein [Oligoflexus sp.]
MLRPYCRKNPTASMYTMATIVLLNMSSIMSPAALAAVSAPNYGEVLQKSLYFYEAQMAGPLPEGHRVPWRGPAAMKDGFAEGVDLTGGFFDAGDHVKFGLPMTYTASILAWSLLLSESSYDAMDQSFYAKRNLRYVADWIMKAHTAPFEFWGQVGNGGLDHGYWGPPEVMQMSRPAYKIDRSCPGSDLAGEAAAALAATSMVFAQEDPAYASQALKEARELYEFADTYRGRYSDCIQDAGTYYRSWSGYQDELVWGGLWLYQATGEASYLKKAETAYVEIKEADGSGKPFTWTMSWDDKVYASYVLLSKLTKNPSYEQDAERWLDYWTAGYQGRRITYSPGGLAWLDSWGSLRYASNTAFLALIYADYLQDNQRKPEKANVYRRFGKKQIDYALGDNPNGRSYVVGYGVNPPQNPHHRAAHGSWTNSLQSPSSTRHTLYGALVGGPGRDDQYADSRDQYVFTEVATDYNAAFTGAIALLVRDHGGAIDAQFPPDKKVLREYEIETKVNSKGQGYLEIASRIVNQTAYPPRQPAKLRYRYMVDLSEIPADLRDPSQVKISTAYNQATSVSSLLTLDPARGLYYIEVDFTGQKIIPAGQSESRREVQFRFSYPSSWIPYWNEKNDPSFAHTGNDWALNSNLPILE